ncbi:MAG: type IX secretion system sortase PorU, partial [Muribaculaceae bacterium]|nr:type IX secretion system sortase PorU [Muribaculaceae bacterium]
MSSIISNLIINTNISSMKRFFSGKRFLMLLTTILISAYSALTVSAISPDFFASSSRLASGNWAKIEVKETGMHLIPNSLLKSLGFNNPEKVNVYGTGGRMLSERLDKNMTDDIPVLPSLVTPDGIVFFAQGIVTWTASAQMPSHKINPYSQSGYYFISDIEESRPEPEILPSVTGRATLTTFMHRLLHEEELTAPSNSGRLIFGEDFRTQNKRSFHFKLPDIVDAPTVRVTFGAKVTNGKSTVGVTLNNNPRSTYSISGVVSSETFLSRQTFSQTGPADENLDVTIDYSNTGVASFAALDYIEVFYPRQLKLTGNDLHFCMSNSTSFNAKLEGCKEDTRIWDVTDPIHPKAVTFTLEGSTATFGAAAGYHEFVAFNTGRPALSVSSAGKVSNQDIHAMDIPDMLIISPEPFMNASRRLADLHLKHDGLKTAILTPEQVYNEFSSGTPDVTAFRKLLKMWHERAKQAGVKPTAYCLLMSRPTYDNKMVTAAVKRNGYPCIPIWQTENMFSENTSYSTDDYIGMLDDNATDINMSTAKIRVAVGRMPVKTAEEAETAVDKLEKYMTKPNLGAWRNSIMIIADDQDNGFHLDQAESVWSNLSKSEKGSNYRYEKLYLDSYRLGFSGTGAVYPEAKTRMLDKINEGVVFIDYIGHANPKSWTHENLLTWNDINNMDNRNLPFLYAATCNFLRWDADEVSGGELLWLNPDAGVIGMICPSRTVYISLNGTLNSATSRYLFSTDEDGNPLRMGDVMVNGKNALDNDNNRLRYAFCGDPAMSLPIPSLELTVDKLNGISTQGAGDFPVFGARSRIEAEGRVTDSNGNTIEDFNGIAELSLYDAEKVIETFGNGSEGKVMYYND